MSCFQDFSEHVDKFKVMPMVKGMAGVRVDKGGCLYMFMFMCMYASG